MTGFLFFNGEYTIPTRPEIWTAAATQDEYFATLSKLQKKVKPLIQTFEQIPDSEPGIIPGGV